MNFVCVYFSRNIIAQQKNHVRSAIFAMSRQTFLKSDRLYCYLNIIYTHTQRLFKNDIKV